MAKLGTSQRVWNVPGLSTIYDLRRQAGRRQRLWPAGAEKDWRDYLDVILDLISNMGEMASVNTHAALYEADPARSRLQTALPTYETSPEVPP